MKKYVFSKIDKSLLTVKGISTVKSNMKYNSLFTFLRSNNASLFHRSTIKYYSNNINNNKDNDKESKILDELNDSKNNFKIKNEYDSEVYYKNNINNMLSIFYRTIISVQNKLTKPNKNIFYSDKEIRIDDEVDRQKLQMNLDILNNKSQENLTSKPTSKIQTAIINRNLAFNKLGYYKVVTMNVNSYPNYVLNKLNIINEFISSSRYNILFLSSIFLLVNFNQILLSIILSCLYLSVNIQSFSDVNNTISEIYLKQDGKSLKFLCCRRFIYLIRIYYFIDIDINQIKYEYSSYNSSVFTFYSRYNNVLLKKNKMFGEKSNKSKNEISMFSEKYSSIKGVDHLLDLSFIQHINVLDREVFSAILNGCYVSANNTLNNISKNVKIVSNNSSNHKIKEKKGIKEEDKIEISCDLIVN